MKIKYPRNQVRSLCRRIDFLLAPNSVLAKELAEQRRVYRLASETAPDDETIRHCRNQLAAAVFRAIDRLEQFRASLLVEPSTERNQLRLDLTATAAPPPPVNGNGGWAALQS